MSAAKKQAFETASEQDPDNLPWTDEQLSAAKQRHVPFVFAIRRALGLSQEQFSSQFEIPIGTIRDWEQHRSEPDAAARAYLRVIAVATDDVLRALKRPMLTSEHSALRSRRSKQPGSH